MVDCPFVTDAGVANLGEHVEFDWEPATVRNLIEAVIEDETVREPAVAALRARGAEARHELETFTGLVPEGLRPLFQNLTDGAV
jgi:hypothetical protein